MTGTGGLSLAVAVFCKEVVRDEDGAVTLHRIFDRAEATGPGQSIEFSMYLSFRTLGRQPSDTTITVVVTRPSGEVVQLARGALSLPQDQGSADFQLTLFAGFEELGTFLFTAVVGDGTRVTMPLLISAPRPSMERTPVTVASP